MSYNTMKEYNIQILKMENPWILEQIEMSENKEIDISINDLKSALRIDKVNNRFFIWELIPILFENGIFAKEDILFKNDKERKKQCLVLRKRNPTDVLGEQWNLIPALLSQSIEKVLFHIARDEWKSIRVYAEEGGSCICGHDITIRIVVKNIYNSRELILGSECVNRVLSDEDLQLVKKIISDLREELGGEY